MSKAMQLVGIILLGSFTLVIIYLMSDVRSTQELDYYLLQEVTEASMYDSIDYSYYRETGLLKVDRDMFLENFNRRFAETVSDNREYTIKIIDFNETPPKVSIEVQTPTVASVNGEVAIVTNRVSGVIETIYDDYVYSRGNYKASNVDADGPKIDVTQMSTDNYKIDLTDNIQLEKYAIVQVNTVEATFTQRDYNAIKTWVDLSRPVITEKTIYQKIASGKSGFWVVVVDSFGLWTAVPVTGN